eukprot:369497_1
MQSLSRNLTNNEDIQLSLPSLEFENDSINQQQKEDEKDLLNGHEEVERYQLEISKMHNLKIWGGEIMNKLYPDLLDQNNIYSFTHIHKNKITKKINKSKLRIKLVAEKDKIFTQIELDNHGWDKMNKTWILNQRTTLLQDILYDIFQVPKEKTASLDQKERGILICEILGMDTDYIGKYEIKVANNKLKKIIASLKNIQSQ